MDRSIDAILYDLDPLDQISVQTKYRSFILKYDPRSILVKIMEAFASANHYTTGTIIYDLKYETLILDENKFSSKTHEEDVGELSQGISHIKNVHIHVNLTKGIVANQILLQHIVHFIDEYYTNVDYAIINYSYFGNDKAIIHNESSLGLLIEYKRNKLIQIELHKKLLEYKLKVEQLQLEIELKH